MTNKALVEKHLLRNEDYSLTAQQTLSTSLSVQTQHYLQEATSSNTRKAYQADIRQFMAWGGLLPATPDVVMRYLTEQAAQLNPRTLHRRLTALKNWHVYQGFADPTAHPSVRKTLTGIKHVHGKPKVKALPLTLETLTILIDHLKKSDRLIALRNSALLLIGFFGAFRRSELVAIRYEDIRFVTEGMEILIPKSKTDQGGEGQVCAIPYGNTKLCPVKALKDWLEQAAIQTGFVFRRMTKQGDVTEQGLAPAQVSLILQSLARECELPDAAGYSSHSFRRGFATTASKKGAPFGAIMRQGRWRHEGTVLGYIDEGKRFETNAAGIVLEFDEKQNK